MIVASAAVVLLLGAACGDDGDGETATDQTDETDATDATDAAVELSGTSWDVATLDADAVASPGSSWITFDDGTANGSGGCNTFSGDYTQDGDQLTIGPLATTLVACLDPAVSEQEGTFLAALDATRSFEMADGRLVLSDGDGAELISLDAATPVEGLTGSWTVTGYNNGDEAVVSIALDTEITIEFDDEGRVTGDSGCNTFMGDYTLDGDTISVGPLASTRRACPDEVMDQETRFLAALESAATWTRERTTAQLRDDTDALALTMTAR